jgi:hypothetical protein
VWRPEGRQLVAAIGKAGRVRAQGGSRCPQRRRLGSRITARRSGNGCGDWTFLGSLLSSRRGSAAQRRWSRSGTGVVWTRKPLFARFVPSLRIVGAGGEGDSCHLNWLPKPTLHNRLRTPARTSKGVLAPSPHEGFSSLHPLPALGRGEPKSFVFWRENHCHAILKSTRIPSSTTQRQSRTEHW